MQTDAYTPTNICQCLGLVGFDVDPQLSKANEAIRLLLKPSFHPEVCVTIVDGRVSVVAARWMIWRQFEPAPMLTDRAEGELSEETFARLVAKFNEASTTVQGTGLAIDGMPVDALLFRSGSQVLRVQQNVGLRAPFAAISAQVISEAWNSLESAYCRNALAEAGKYAGLTLPLTPEPPRKPTIETLILGPEGDRIQLMQALKKHHGD